MHINAFPPEILVNIFEQGKASAPTEIGGSTLLFAVSQVCVAWRSIAHRYPALWDDLHFSARSSPQKARNLFARYQGPTIAVTIDRSMPPSDPIAYWNLLNSVTAEAERLRSLRFVGPARSLRLLSHACVRHTFPQLKELAFIESAAVPEAGDPQHISIDSPNLVSLSFTRLLPLGKGTYPHLRELTLEESRYFIHFDQPDGFIEPWLLDLDVLSITTSPLPFLRNPALRPTDSSLVSLRLCGLRPADVAPDSLARFLRLVRMPFLQCLEVSGLVDYLQDEFIHALCALPGYPLLRSLTLRSISLAGIEWHGDALRAVQSVAEIHLVNVDPQPLVRMLDRDRAVCPNLREIWLGGAEVVRIRSRCPS
ncbi:hypothetical protein FB451DRAFT_1281069 [Mycena latifolia]|nr:hypothetical protein FB451DRAFT_1281069 [Mycena latifolia]